jgi:hypothetical protein
MRTTAHLMNRTPLRQLGWKTPIQVMSELTGISPSNRSTRPNLGYIRIFGCKAYAKEFKIPKLQKMRARAQIGYLVGYDSSNIFRIWNPRKNTVFSTRDVKFDETRKFDPKSPYAEDQLLEAIDEPTFLIEVPDIQETYLGMYEEIEPIAQEPLTELNGPSESSEPQVLEKSKERTAVLPTPESTPDPETNFPIPMAPSREISADVSESNIIEGPRTRKRSDRRQAYLTDLQNANELPAFYATFGTGLTTGTKRYHRDELPSPPKSWAQMLRHPHKEGFLAAAQKEYTEVDERHTWKAVPRPQKTQVIPLMWVFIYKFDTNGYLVKYKARICVRGDLQRFGLQDTYAATLAAKTFRTLMAITAYFDLEAIQQDAVNAFLNSPLDEVIYCEFPDGFKQQGSCLLLLLALYGLRRSPRLWQKELGSTLKEMGLRQSTEDPCLFTNDFIIVLFFVDDFILLSRKEHRDKLEEFRDTLASRYKMRDEGELQWFLGIRVVRDRERRKLWLCQDSYIDKVVTRYHLQDARGAPTPLPVEIIHAHDGQADAQQIHLYQGKIGSILYAAVMTRPDISCAVSKLSEHLTNPSNRHHELADRVISYLNENLCHRIFCGQPVQGVFCRKRCSIRR